MANTNISLVSIICLCLLGCSSTEGLQEITAKRGENVTLTCRGTRDATIQLLQWSKPDLSSQEYVYLIRNGRTNENYHHETFRGRVELRDSKMKDGDCSIILKNVTISDTGTYECHVGSGGSSELISSIILKVINSGGGAGRTEDGGDKDGGDKDGGDKDGHVGLVVGLSVVGVLLLAAGITGGLVMYKKHKGGSTY